MTGPRFPNPLRFSEHSMADYVVQHTPPYRSFSTLLYPSNAFETRLSRYRPASSVSTTIAHLISCSLPPDYFKLICTTNCFNHLYIIQIQTKFNPKYDEKHQPKNENIKRKTKNDNRKEEIEKAMYISLLCKLFIVYCTVPYCMMGLDGMQLSHTMPDLLCSY